MTNFVEEAKHKKDQEETKAKKTNFVEEAKHKKDQEEQNQSKKEVRQNKRKRLRSLNRRKPEKKWSWILRKTSQ